jgi:hypothetical protein
MSNFHRSYETKLYLDDVVKVYVVTFFLKKEGRTFSASDRKNLASNLFMGGLGGKYSEVYVPSLTSWVTSVQDQVCLCINVCDVHAVSPY